MLVSSADITARIPKNEPPADRYCDTHKPLFVTVQTLHRLPLINIFYFFNLFAHYIRCSMLRRQLLTKTTSVLPTATAFSTSSLSNTNAHLSSSTTPTKRKHTSDISSQANSKRRMSSKRGSPSPRHAPRPDIERFVRAQAGVGVWGDTYDEALRQLRRGRKRGHWIWYVFPQVAGLSMSGMGQRFSIHSLDEARAYVAHPTLGARLKEATEAVLEAPTKDVEELFGGSLDAQKFRSSMTLFARAAQGPGKQLFERALAVYWDGERDEMTVDIMDPEPTQDDLKPLKANDEVDSDRQSDVEGQNADADSSRRDELI